MKKIIKSTLAVAIVAASAAIGYTSVTQYQNKQLAYANPLMEENIDALADQIAPGWYTNFTMTDVYYKSSSSGGYTISTDPSIFTSWTYSIARCCYTSVDANACDFNAEDAVCKKVLRRPAR